MFGKQVPVRITGLTQELIVQEVRKLEEDAELGDPVAVMVNDQETGIGIYTVTHIAGADTRLAVLAYSADDDPAINGYVAYMEDTFGVWHLHPTAIVYREQPLEHFGPNWLPAAEIMLLATQAAWDEHEVAAH
jgi:hypothetical protein